MKTQMRCQFLILTLLFAAFLLCGCHKKNERMLQAEEKYKDYPFHLLALANKPIDNNKNLDLSLINESVYGRTPLQLLVEYHYQYRRLKKRKSIKVLKSFLEHGADINSLWDDAFRFECEVICNCIMYKANHYLQEFLRLSGREYVDLSFSGDEVGGAEYVMGAISFLNFDAVPILLPYTKNINTTNKKGQNALHYAASYPAPYKTIKLLIDNGADFTMRDVDGRTPYDLYLYNSPDKFHSKTARLFREISGLRY